MRILKKLISIKKKTKGGKMGNISQVCHSECTGCGACYNICPVKAISMKENSEGFLYPVVDAEKCTNCGLCEKSCAILNTPKPKNSDNPKCYAVMASDEVRAKSSSGGIFTLVADYVLDKGGCVCGASYNDDFSVSHIIIDNKSDLDKLRGSKYLQSNTEDCYKEIKKLLNNGREVLFTGTPCQVAGLNSFLGKGYDNLLTMELLCHGAPSYKVFRKYLDENHEFSNIKSVNFRDKAVKWRSDYLTLEMKDGTIFREEISKNTYEQGFHAGLFNRMSCAPCKFAKLPRQADITIADWWGIIKIDKELDDAKGTSLVLVNNEKAHKVFADVEADMLKIKEIPLKKAMKSVNKTIYRPLSHNAGREKFFKHLDMTSFNKNVKMSLKNKYDVGVMGLWAGNNYGCILTGYALYRMVENLGYSVAFVDRRRLKKPLDRTTMVRRFTKELNVVAVDTQETYKLNNHFDTFLMGSDQVWRYDLVMKNSRYYLLDFALSNKLKVAYASSYGNKMHSGRSEEEMSVLAYLMNNFDAISVRENYAVDGLKQTTGVDAVQVLDPVFVCGKQVYEELIQQSDLKLDDEDYIFAYLLDPTDEKNRVLEYIAKQLGKKLYVTTDATNNAFKRTLLKEGVVLGEIDVQDWLNYYKHSSYVVTDSFHGTCFSIIFEKPFVSLGNVYRGLERFNSLLGGFGLESRLFTSLEDLKSRDLLNQSIDYVAVNQIIEREKQRSLDWLKQSLSIKKSPFLSDYDITRKLISIFSYSKGYYKNRYKLNRLLYKISFGKCRKKYKERAKYWHEKLSEYNKYKGFMQRSFVEK